MEDLRAHMHLDAIGEHLMRDTARSIHDGGGMPRLTARNVVIGLTVVLIALGGLALLAG